MAYQTVYRMLAEDNFDELPRFLDELKGVENKNGGTLGRFRKIL